MLKLIRLYIVAVTCYAIQHNGIFGPWSGQIGKSLVGFKNKAVDVIRKYVIPANPKTFAQTEQRSKFTLCEKVASKILITITRPFWNFKSSKYSGFNAFIKENIQRVDGDEEFESILITSGSYPGLPSISTKNYDPLTGILNVKWPENVPTNGNASDVIPCCVLVTDEYNPGLKKYILKAYTETNALRSQGATGYDFTLELGITVTNIFIYLGVRNPTTATKIETADSINSNPVAI